MVLQVFPLDCGVLVCDWRVKCCASRCIFWLFQTPVSLDMYQSSYMTDYRPYGDYRQSTVHSQVRWVFLFLGISLSAAVCRYLV